MTPFTNWNIIVNIIMLSTAIASIAEASIDSSTACKPNTHIDIGCNTCFCDKTGRIDPKWCTEDECVTTVRDVPNTIQTALTFQDACIPGSVLRRDCNVCICPQNGTLSTKHCTNSVCSKTNAIIDAMLSCPPRSYYRVDCNICRCPDDGRRNVAMCTKRSCSKSSLRSNTGCVPGTFSSEGCRVCVCPPSGVTDEELCSDVACEINSDRGVEGVEQFAGNFSAEGGRRLSLCFPGEVFRDHCRVCVCTELGLRSYAECTSAVCDDDYNQLASASCSPGYKVLNDCNMCTCDHHGRYICSGANCEVHDVFGDFNDAIQEISVGMEGHGAWRRVEQEACEPNVLYKREDINCVCDPDGTWATGICRDVFKNLYNVQLTPLINVTCDQSLVYIVGCDVCVCPPQGMLSSATCTKRRCDKDFSQKLEKLLTFKMPVKGVHTVYGSCEPGQKTNIGCSECTCLERNKLSCDDSHCPVDRATSELSHKEPEDRLNQPLDDFSSITFQLQKQLSETSTGNSVNIIPVPALVNIDSSGKSRNVQKSEYDKENSQSNKRRKFKNQAYNKEASIVEIPLLDNLRYMFQKDLKNKGSFGLNHHSKLPNREVFYQEYPLHSLNIDPRFTKPKESLRYYSPKHYPKQKSHQGYIDGFKHRLDLLDQDKSEEQIAPHIHPPFPVVNEYDDPAVIRNMGILKNYQSPLRPRIQIIPAYKNLQKIATSSNVGNYETRGIEPDHQSSDDSVDVIPIVIPFEHQCKAGESFKVGCNICFCLSNGNKLCTLKDCESATSKHAGFADYA